MGNFDQEIGGETRRSRLIAAAQRVQPKGSVYMFADYRKSENAGWRQGRLRSLFAEDTSVGQKRIVGQRVETTLV